MITLPTNVILSEIAPGGHPTPGTRGYLQGRAMHRFYTYLTDKFAAEEKAGRISKAELARRTGRDASTISRLLGRPSNMTISTLTDLLVGIAGEEPIAASAKVSDRRPTNYRPQLAFKNHLTGQEADTIDKGDGDLNAESRKAPQLAGTA